MHIRKIPVEDASAWTMASIKADPSWIYTFTADDLAELDAALDRVRHLPVTAITVREFELTRLDGLLRQVAFQVEHGTGMAILRGLPVLNYSKDDASRIYWGIGQHLGKPVTQNRRGHLLGHVKDEGVKYSHGTRGYNTTAQLNFHCDNTDIVGLLCLRQAMSGGASRITSSMSVFNRILRERPDLLPVYFEGFHYYLKEEHLPGKPKVTEWKIPVFSECEGRLSCRYVRNAIMPGFTLREAEPTPIELEALDYFDAMARSPELAFEMLMEPGDMQLLNNHVCLHSRTDFVDFPEEGDKRHLLRLWLRTDVRPLESAFADRYGRGTGRMGVPLPEAMAGAAP